MTMTEPTTEPMTTVIQAVQIPTATVEAIASMQAAIDCSGLHELLEVFHRDHLPTYQGAVDAVGNELAEECDRVTGYANMHATVAELAGSLLAAIGEDGFGASRPDWAPGPEVEALAALLAEREREGQGGEA